MPKRISSLLRKPGNVEKPEASAKQVPALFKKSSAEAEKPQPSEKTQETSTKLSGSLGGGLTKSIPENGSTATADNITGKTKTVTEKGNRSKKAAGVRPNKAVTILGDIFTLMKEDREDYVKNKQLTNNKQEGLNSAEEKQHKEIIGALGGSTGGSTGGESSKGGDKKSKKKSSKTKADRAGLLGNAIGLAGLGAMVGVSKITGVKSGTFGPEAAPATPTPTTETKPAAAAPTTKAPPPASKPEVPTHEFSKPPGEKPATGTASPAGQATTPAATPPATASPATASPASAVTTPSGPTPSGGVYGIAKPMIEKHEGRKTKPYQDTKGLWTIGVGHLIGNGKTLPDNMNREFSNKEVDDMFASDYEHHEKAAKQIPGYDKLNDSGKAALVDLTFNMGPTWYRKWPDFTKQLQAGDTEGAAKNLEGSAWYKQVGHRGPAVVNLIRNGKGQAGGAPAEASGGPATEASKASSMPAPTASPALPGGGATASSAASTVDKTATPVAAAKPPGELSSLVTTQSGVDMNIQGSLATRVSSMAAAFQTKTGKKLLITSGFRSNDKQKQLWEAKLAENKGDVAATRKMVAEPSAPLGNGRGSQHMLGLAIDINSKGPSGLNVLAGPRTQSTGWLESFGLIRPVNNEDWHVQMSGTPPTPDNPDKPGDPVIVPSKDGASDPSSGAKKPEPKAVESTPAGPSAVPAGAMPAATAPPAPAAAPAPSPAPPAGPSATPAGAVPAAPVLPAPAPPAPPAAPPAATGTKLASISSENKDMKNEMEDKAKAPNIVNNNISSSSSPNPQSSMGGESENDEPSYLRKVLYG